MLKKYMLLLLLLFPANVCFANDVLPIYMWQMLETDNLSNVDSDINNPYLKLYQRVNILSLQQKVEAARSREQSLANKILSGATMAATGIGGMQLASGLSEQQSDKDAENAMRAYLATFTCKYGDNRVSGGKTDVELPGGNELIGLYSEYVALANDLKTRKAALGIKPGIESESILDSATGGLYDDAGLESRPGAYTSLSRALSDPNGADAAAWAAQKEESSKQVTTGATVGGVGAAGGAIGNLIINRDKK